MEIEQSKQNIKKMKFNPIAEFIDKLIVAKPLSYKNLALFPVLMKITEEEKHNYTILQEGLTFKSIYIYETGRMEELRVINRSNDEIFIMAGETLLGGGQNRIINLPLSIRPNTSTKVQSSCVEINRWEVPANFSEENASTFNNCGISPLNLKNLVINELITNYLNENVIKVNQHKVWNLIVNYLKKGKIKSSTLDINDLFIHYKGEIEDFCNCILIQKNQVGCITAVNNEIICTELFGDKNIFRKMYSLLLKSYAIEAILNPTENFTCKLDIQKAQNFIKILKTCKIIKYKLNNECDIFFIQSPKAQGISLSNESKVIYLTSFLKLA